MSEKVGRHKGAVETLMHEQKELSRLLQIVQGQLERHMNALEDAGVDTEEFVEKLQQGQEQSEPEQSDSNEQKSEDRHQRGTRDHKENSQDTKRSNNGEGSSGEDVDDFLEGEEDSENDDFAPY